MSDIAPYISSEEYQCQHCRKLPPEMDGGGAIPEIYSQLFETFRFLRELWGHPIQITSGYRCPVHEREVSGSNLGPHIFGLSLDLGLTVKEQPDFVGLVETNCPNLRMGTNVKPGSVHIHIDTCYLLFPRYSLDLVRGARWIE